MGVPDKIVVGVALGLVGVSFLTPGGLYLGLILATLLLVAFYGGQYLLDLEKSRRMGERSGTFREQLAGSEEDNGGWKR